jgi:4-aminobutyrate aminotransferase
MRKILNLPGPKAREIIERDKLVISASYPRAYPFVMDHGFGSEVWDVDGNRFLDFAAGIAVASTGHSHPRVVKAIQDQAERFLHISSDYYHPLWVELGEKINDIAPFMDRAVSFMTNSGTESIEAAIKLARYYTGRTEFIGFFGGFHGRTMGSLSFTASKSMYHKSFFPLMNGVVHAPYPNEYRPLLAMNPGEDYGEIVVRYIEEEILGHILPPENVAGILVEPIQGEGGYVVPAAGFFPALRKLCDKYGILLIVDEVQSGVGRTGLWWAVEHFNTEPDIVCAAKGIASGFPLGIMFAREEIMNWPKGAHGNTYGGNPMACAAALATLELIDQGYMENAALMGQLMIDRLIELKSRYPFIGDIRGKGLMIGLEFVKDPLSKVPDEKLRDAIVDEAFTQGLLLLGSGKNVVRISPPLCIGSGEVDEAMAILEDVFKQVAIREKKRIVA